MHWCLKPPTSLLYLRLLKVSCACFCAGQKLFSCHMCNTSFSTKGSLKVHMRLHTGSKPFKCPHCDLRFRTSGHRKTHIQGHIRPSDRKAKRSSSTEPQSSGRQEVQSVPQTQHPSQAVDTQPSVGLLQTATTDPNIYIPGNSVLAGQYDPSLLQQGLVGQAILPATVSGNYKLYKHCMFVHTASQSQVKCIYYYFFIRLFSQPCKCCSYWTLVWKAHACKLICICISTDPDISLTS